MQEIEVWLRHQGDFCRVGVNGIENAKWLLNRLSQSFIFRTTEPLGESLGTSICSFRIPYNPPLSRSRFERLMAAMPGVKLMP